MILVYRAVLTRMSSLWSPVWTSGTGSLTTTEWVLSGLRHPNVGSTAAPLRRAKAAAPGAVEAGLPVDAHPGRLSRPPDVFGKSAVALCPRDHIEWVATRSKTRAHDLPVPDMPGQDDSSPSSGEGPVEVLGPPQLGRPTQLLPHHPRQTNEFDQTSAQMLIAAAIRANSSSVFS